MKITVLSDVHYISRRMMENVTDRELLMKPAISEQALKQAASEETDVILITGDLTDAGDKPSHDDLIKILRDIKKSGKKVYVTTATHDFHHYEAYVQKYGGSVRYSKMPWSAPFFDRDAENYAEIVEEEFAALPHKDIMPELEDVYSQEELWRLYYEFGPSDAVSVCEDAHAYCVALDDKTWCLMLNDDFRNNEQGNASATYSPTCFRWIDGIIKEARKKGIFVFACTHHPLLPPVPAYKIGADYKNMRAAYVGHMLADIGVELVFSGHTHFSDIGFMRSERGALLCDITTPSVRFYPPEYRVADIDGENGIIDVRSVAVDKPEGFDIGGRTLREYFRDAFYHEYTVKVAALPSPVNTIVANAKVKHLYPLCRSASGLTKSEYNEIKDMRIFDIIINFALNMLGGDGEYTPDTPVYKFLMGLSAVIDSIVETQPFYDVRKKLLKGYTVSEIIEPMLFNNLVPDRNAHFNFRTEPERRYPAAAFSSQSGEILMGLLCVLMIPLSRLAPIAAVIALPAATLIKKHGRKKNPVTPERY